MCKQVVMVVARWKAHDDVAFAGWCHKLEEAGKAYCSLCRVEIRYDSGMIIIFKKTRCSMKIVHLQVKPKAVNYGAANEIEKKKRERERDIFYAINCWIWEINWSTPAVWQIVGQINFCRLLLMLTCQYASPPPPLPSPSPFNCKRNTQPDFN